jgi:tetratricopeptide (TPR) repeat protein
MNAASYFLRSKLFLLSLTAHVLSVGVLWAQTPNPQLSSSQTRIARDLEVIHIGEQQHFPPARQAASWEQLASQYEIGTDFLKAEDAYLRALHLLKSAPTARTEYAFTLDNLSSLYMIYRRLDDAESARKQAIKVRQKIGNPAETGQSEVHLADIALMRHQYDRAERLALQALPMMESSSNPPRAGILSAFIALTFARCSRGHCEEGLMNARQAVTFANKNFEAESAANGFALESLGFAEWKSGASEDAGRTLLQALQILRTRLSATDPRLRGVMSQYRSYLIEAHRPADAQEIENELTRVTSQAGVYCQTCTVSVGSLSTSLR